MALNKSPTVLQSIQFLGAHRRIACAVHEAIGTPPPITVGFVQLVESPPGNISVIFSTSIPTISAKLTGKSVASFIIPCEGFLKKWVDSFQKMRGGVRKTTGSSGASFRSWIVCC